MGHLPVLLLLISLTLLACQHQQPKDVPTKLPIKVVVVTMFEPGEDIGDQPGEFQHWVEKLPLQETIPFPQGYRDLRYNPDLGILGIVTGIGNTKSGISITALGSDPRFDLSKAYWLVAGISGIDPADAPTGSAVWAERLIDGDLSHEIDAREMPKEWSTGYIPLLKTKPYEKPFPLKDKDEIVANLHSGLVNWAYELTKDTPLTDNETIQKMRARYSDHPASKMNPFVLKGDQLAASTYWHGALLNEWANEWVDYWTEGQGNFVTSAMEDIGAYHALERLDKSGKVDKNRLLVLRTASNFTMQWKGASAYESFAGDKLTGEGYSAYIPSLDAAYAVGNIVVQAILENWEEYEKELPK